jgi:hypothetical protein
MWPAPSAKVRVQKNLHRTVCNALYQIQYSVNTKYAGGYVESTSTPHVLAPLPTVPCLDGRTVAHLDAPPLSKQYV